MDNSGEVADLMVKESIQITEATIKLLAAGGKNMTAFLLALARDNKKLYGKTNMKKLLQAGRGLKNFYIKESDLDDFRAYAQKKILFAVIKDNRSNNGIVDLVTNEDYVPLVNRYLEQRGYPAPGVEQEAEASKKAAPRARPERSSPQRGSGSTARQMRSTETTEAPESRPSVKEKLDICRDKAEQKRSRPVPQRTRPVKTQAR